MNLIHLKSCFSSSQFRWILIFKLFILCIFNSEYNEGLFYPFLNVVSGEILNPWNYSIVNGLNLDSFPYHGLMLLILYPFALLGKLTGIGSVLIKFPLLISDVLIYYILTKIFKNKQRLILFFYFLNPIVIYATYIHSQLDIIPTAFILACIYFLINDKYKYSAVFLGLALSTKLHVAISIPLIFIYIYRAKSFYASAIFISLSFLVIIFFDLPYLFDVGFSEMVLNNPKQHLLFDTYYKIGSLKIILPLAIIFLTYFHFFNQNKVNQDLLFFYFGILFTVAVIFIYPGPAWYVWMTPFITVYFIKSHDLKKSKLLFYLLSASYLLFFIFFYKSEYQDILFLGVPVDYKIHNELCRNIAFTLLEVVLIVLMYGFYNYGLKSNSIYSKRRNLTLGIGGDSGVGKSILLMRLDELLGERLLQIEGDGEHKWERGDANWSKFTHLDPKANHIHKQAEAIQALKNHETISRSEYDHSNGKFSEPILVFPKEFIVIAGLHPFYLPKSRKIIDIKIFVNTDEKLRRHWKILRDTKKRGYDIEKIQNQIEARLVDAQKYIYPQKEYADIVVEYYPLGSLLIGDNSQEIKLSLKLTFDANVNVEHIVQRLNGDFLWDYNTDLKTQFLDVKELEYLNFEEIAFEIIPNIHEIVSPNAKWSSGHDGLIQLICLLMVSEKLKEL
jgi:uridine kinase